MALVTRLPALSGAALLLVVGCTAPTPVTDTDAPDAVAADADAAVDAARDVAPDAPSDGGLDVPSDGGLDAVADALADVALDTPGEVTPDAPADVPSADVAPPRCAADTADALVRALRTPPPPGVSAVAAPGMRFESLRAPFDANATSRALLERARVYSRGNPTALPTGNAGAFQTFATRALGAALVAWHDRDATAASVCLRTLAAMAIPPEWLLTATDVPLRMGAGLLGMAGAVDLLSATDGVTAEQLAAARAAVATAAASLDAWLLAGGLYFTAGHLDNHSMRFAAGFAAAALVTPSATVSDDLLRWSLAQMSASIDQQTGGAAGWAEGSMYFSYGFEIAAPALAAVDRAWAGDDTVCVRCPAHAMSACGEGAVTVRRPSADARLRDLVQWSASLETDGGWLAYVDDSRLSSQPSPLLEAMVSRRAFARWSIDGATGSTGASLWVHPFVALALASPAPTETLPLRRVWPEAGTARVDGVTAGGAAQQAFVLGERGAALAGVGHERPDVATLSLAVGGTLVLGPSGYNGYDDREPFARADAASGITVEGVLSRALGAGEAGPAGELTAAGEVVTSRFAGSGVTVTRGVSFEGATLVVRDAVEVTGEAREVGWHWHLRGALEADGWRWTAGARRCGATQTGEASPLTRETAPHYDVAGRAETHPVVRQLARLAAGRHELVTRVTCE